MLNDYEKKLKRKRRLIETGTVKHGTKALIIVKASSFPRVVIQCGRCKRIKLVWMIDFASGKTKGCGCMRGKWKR
jgi:hypothetical protein